VGNCLFLRARGSGIDRQVKTKLQIPGGMPGGGGMVTGRIEPCIRLSFANRRNLSAKGLFVALKTSMFYFLKVSYFSG